LVRLGILLALALCVRVAAAEEPSHDATPGSHHRFDDVEHWASVFDDPARDAWQKPRELVAALGIRPGMAVADLGAGTGYFSHHLARAVGPHGTVFAVDVEPNLVVHLRERAEREQTENVVPVLASTNDARLPAGRVDFVLIVDTYHHIDDRLHYLVRLKGALRRDGRVAIVEWQKRELPIGPEMEHKIARELVVDEMTSAGYRLVEEPDVLPYQYVLVFGPK
jgi:ubiquinone/menaquinone biosynthesis C-methylase UbiE